MILPPGFFDGLHNLRLLGNDTALPEARHYENVDKQAVEIALGFTRQVLLAVSQYSHWQDQLEALKTVE